MSEDSAPLLHALAQVIDPELRRPITELGMVEKAQLSDTGTAEITVLLTIAGCPLKDTIVDDVHRVLADTQGVHDVALDVSVMSPDQRARLIAQLKPERGIPFNKPESLTKVYAVASGKGGVGKSTVTVNLACSMARSGLRVGIIDADIYGFSVPALMGLTREGRAVQPTKVDEMIIPPVAHDVKVISIGMFVAGNQPIAWRGPMLDRALEQFLSEVYFGDLDVLFLDLPPGTGDIAISVAQRLPVAELLIVTTPQPAAADVAVRAGAIATTTGQKLAGVVENMSALINDDGTRLEVFGSGGGEDVSERLTSQLGATVPLLGQIPLDVNVRQGGDSGVPVVLARPGSAASAEIERIARGLAARPRGLSGKSLGVSPR